MHTLFTKPWAIILVIVSILTLWTIGTYNHFVSLHGGVKAAWSTVEVQEQRRMDLIPNLVSTVKGAANFEKDTFKEVTAARSAWAQAGSLGDRAAQIKAAGTFDSALSRLLVTVEAYPQLQATQAFRDLMTQLEGTENRITVARKDYNDATFAYNVAIHRLPGMILASLMGFSDEQLFKAREGADVPPVVDFAS